MPHHPTTQRLGEQGEFCWLDVKTHDVDATAAFFSAVFGWTFAADEDDWRRATKIYADGHAIGGVSDLSGPPYPPGTPAHVAYYLAVDAVDRLAEAATAAGARLILPPFDAGDLGRIATLLDPAGAAVSLWQPGSFGGWELPEREQPLAAAAPVRLTLASPDPEATARFYRETLEAHLTQADFEPAAVPGPPQWELTLSHGDLSTIADRVRAFGAGTANPGSGADEGTLRVCGPEGIAFRLAPA